MSPRTLNNIMPRVYLVKGRMSGLLKPEFLGYGSQLYCLGFIYRTSFAIVAFREGLDLGIAYALQCGMSSLVIPRAQNDNRPALRELARGI